MARSFQRNNLLAGLFVILGLILAVVVAVLVSGAQKYLVPTHPYAIRFSLADGAAGLKVGSIVNVGGQPVGRVTALDFQRPAPEAMPSAILVRIVINRSVPIAADALAYLEKPLLGSMSAINIINGPTGPSTALLAPGSTMQGMIAPPAFLAQAGFGPEQARQVQTLFARAADVVERVDRMSTRIETELEPVLASVRSATDDVADVTRRVRERTPEWTSRVDSVLAQADQLAQDARQSIADLRAAVDANRPALDRAMENIETITRRVRDESVGKLNDALDSGAQGVAEFRSALGDISALIREQEPNVRRALANFRLASDQIKLTSLEVRRSPWRLLYQPRTRELESELFYDAARAYAEAVSDLRATSEALESSLGAAGPGSPAARMGLDRVPIEQLKQRLAAAFERYEQAEKVLLDRIIQRAP